MTCKAFLPINATFSERLFKLTPHLSISGCGVYKREASNSHSLPKCSVYWRAGINKRAALRVENSLAVPRFWQPCQASRSQKDSEGVVNED